MVLPRCILYGTLVLLQINIQFVMSNETMPVAEVAVADAQEQNSYEFAFHVLPTVAEGEVEGIFSSLKELVTKQGGTLLDEEAPDRFELAYDIVKHIDGKNRKFSSAYFGWIRFSAESQKIDALTEAIEARPELLRYILIKLTKVEQENPFRFHEALAAEKMVTTVEESKVMPDISTGAESSEDTSEVKTEDESEEGEVDEKKLDEALETKSL